MRRSGRKIEPGAGRSLLNLDDPEVGIEGDFAFEPFLGLAGSDAVLAVRPSENPLDAPAKLGRYGLGAGP